MEKKIAIIGAGNMGTSLLGGLIAKNYPPEKICISDPSIEKLTYLQEKFHVQINTDNLAAIKIADIVIFAVKPQIFPEVAKELAELISQSTVLVISIAAGVTVERMQEWINEKTAIVRAMPNMPTLIGCGASALFANKHVSALQKTEAEGILGAVGITVWLEEEKLMDAVTALSGSGPAYFFLMMQALREAGEKLGLPANIANILTLQTAYGAARMACENQKNAESLVQLRQAVTSRGGTTEKAIKILESANFNQIIYEAVFAAKERAAELGQITK
jgi:pyrroline-5-carboxylate reductase